MADGFVQHDAGPAGAEHDVHFAGGGRYRFQVDQRFADRAVRGLAPGPGFDEARIALASAIAARAAFLAAALARDHRNIDAHKRADVTIAFAIGTKDFDHLPGRAQADRDLADPGF